jgi:voltage-gated potassium channel
LRRQFEGSRGDRSVRPARRLRFGVIGLLGVLVAGTLGFVGFGYSVLDAIFQTVITISTVGFGEVHRFGSGQKVFTILLILVGVGMAAYTFSVLVETLVEGYVTDEFRRRRMERQIENLHDHLILCGWGRVGRAIARHVGSSDVDVVVVDSSPDRVTTVGGLSLCGDATDEDVLRAACCRTRRLIV